MNEHNEIPNYQDELLQLNELLERLHGWENLNIKKLKKEKIEDLAGERE